MFDNYYLSVLVLIIYFFVGYFIFLFSMLLFNKRIDFSIAVSLSITGFVIMGSFLYLDDLHFKCFSMVLILLGNIVSLVNLYKFSCLVRNETGAEDNKEIKPKGREKSDEEFSEKIIDVFKNINLVELPLKKSIIFKESYCFEMPKMVEDLTVFAHKLSDHLVDYCDDVRIIDKKAKINYTDSFLFGISKTMHSFFFEKDPSVRIHWRVYNKEDDVYECFNVYNPPKQINHGKMPRVLKKKSSKTKEEYKEKRTVTVIPACEKSMVSESSDNNCSIIMRLNPDLHRPTTNTPSVKSTKSGVWKNYITFSFGPDYKNSNEHSNNRFNFNGKPILSFTISISNDKESLNNRLLFLNYVKFEGLIGKYLSYFNDKVIDLKGAFYDAN